MNWVVTLRVDADDVELQDILSELYVRLGERVRVLTQVEWLYEENRKAAKP